MKTLIVAIATLLTATVLWADCEYLKNEVDSFTKERKILMKDQQLTNYAGVVTMNLSVVYVDGLYALYTYFHTDDTGKSFIGFIRSGGKVLIKLDNDEVVALEFATTDFGDKNRRTNKTIFASILVLDATSLKALKEKRVKEIRVYFSEGYMDMKVVKETLIMRQIECLLQAKEG